MSGGMVPAGVPFCQRGQGLATQRGAQAGGRQSEDTGAGRPHVRAPVSWFAGSDRPRMRPCSEQVMPCHLSRHGSAAMKLEKNSLKLF